MLLSLSCFILRRYCETGRRGWARLIAAPGGREGVALIRVFGGRDTGRQDGGRARCVVVCLMISFGHRSGGEGALV